MMAMSKESDKPEIMKEQPETNSESMKQKIKQNIKVELPESDLESAEGYINCDC